MRKMNSNPGKEKPLSLIVKYSDIVSPFVKFNVDPVPGTENSGVNSTSNCTFLL